MHNFWHNLPRPFWVLAPMEDVTDTVFRQVVAKCGAPDVFFSEFANVAGLSFEAANPELGQIVSHRLEKTGEKDFHGRPIVAQIWGITPEDYRRSAAKIVELGFDGIDINMGCPVKNVIKQGACSALIKNPNLAAEIIAATKEGSRGLIPVSVKTRIGFSHIDTDNWASFLLSQNLQALTIHGRTVKEESKVPCHWDQIGRVVQINNQMWQGQSQQLNFAQTSLNSIQTLNQNPKAMKIRQELESIWQNEFSSLDTKIDLNSSEPELTLEENQQIIDWQLANLAEFLSDFLED